MINNNEIQYKEDQIHQDKLNKILEDTTNLIKKEENKRARDKSFNVVQNDDVSSGTNSDIEEQKNSQTAENVNNIQEDSLYKIDLENNKYELDKSKKESKQQAKLMEKTFELGLQLIKNSKK